MKTVLQGRVFRTVPLTKILLVMLVLVCLFTLVACNDDEVADTSDQFRLIVPENWELEIGDSRSVDYAFAESKTSRTLSWKVTPSAYASVDSWGRVTAKAPGLAIVTATTSDGLKSSAMLHVVASSTNVLLSSSIVNYSGTAIALGDNLQKIVTRYALDSTDAAIPAAIKNITDYSAYQSATTTDNAVWSIMSYGVLRTDNTAANDRDVEQRFMGDRYFYEADTTTGKVLGIEEDGALGIWTIMATGYTHIEMVEMSGEDKAELMVAATEECVSRRGMVSEAHLGSDGEWKSAESDNDGLWTSMYGAGELMRYASLKAAGASSTELAEAKRSALLATEAVLLLSNLCMRTGTTQAYVRYQPNAMYDDANGRYLSEEALEEGGDYSLNLPYMSPSDMYASVYETYLSTGDKTYIFDETYMTPFEADDWSNPLLTEDTEYATRTRNLEGYIVRTYSFDDEGNDTNGYIYWEFNGDGTATGVSTKSESSLGYYLNGENLREVVVDASGEVPARLWNDLIGEGYTVEDITYKADTSSDELIGHLFLYKLAYDILGPEDAELKGIISNTMERLAQHVSDNNYMMVDGSGQPGTWSKFNREFFYNSSQMGGAPLTAAVALCMFKVAYYVTGNVKWENEYRMAALDPSYEYAELMTQYGMQCELVMANLLGEYVGGSMASLVLDSLSPTGKELLLRFFLNYSDEEMAMLAFYLLFQMETDEQLLTYYREAIDEWWASIKYSENPLWYYIYQLAYPGKTVTDAYGNNVLETAAWSLSRHPIDTRRYSASNTARDDCKELSLSAFGFGDSATLCFNVDESGTVTTSGGFMEIFDLLDDSAHIVWAVAAPDERSMHKYNGESYDLNGCYNPNEMEGSTTYTLPFWMGVYHKMLTY